MTRRGLLLHLLRQAGERGITTNEIMHAGIGSRYGARLLELRDEGHVIDSERVRDGQWRYTLLRDAARDSLPVEPLSPASGSTSQAVPQSAPEGLFPASEFRPGHWENAA